LNGPKAADGRVLGLGSRRESHVKEHDGGSVQKVPELWLKKLDELHDRTCRQIKIK